MQNDETGLRITAIMENGFAGYNPYIPLDGALMYWALREKIGGTLSHRMNGELIYPDLPLAQYENGDFWCWKISFGMYDNLGENVEYWRKRFRMQHLQYLEDPGKQVHTNSGRYKDYNMPIVHTLTTEIHWEAVGIRDQLEPLCRKITYLGKKSSQGYGHVLEWNIDEMEHPRWWYRAFPADLWQSIDGEDVEFEGMHGVRPPYWHHENQMLSIMPKL